MGCLVVALGHLFGPRRPSARKGSPYESGMVPYSPGSRRISVRYYLVAVLFIIFEFFRIFNFTTTVTCCILHRRFKHFYKKQ